jgi:hypothetical protein
MPVEMERGAVSARGAKSAERRARIDASIFFAPGESALLRRRWRIYLPSEALSHCARSSACRCSVISRSTSPAWSSAALGCACRRSARPGTTHERPLIARAVISFPSAPSEVTPIVILSVPGALMASDTHWSPPPGRSCPDSGPAIATTSLIRLRKRRWRTARPVRHCRGRAGSATLEHPRVLRAVWMTSPSTPNTISGRNAFIELLQSEGVTHLFGNPGTT